MSKQIDNTNIGGLLEDLIGRIKAAFWGKNDIQQLSIDNFPKKSSNNLVKSGGVYLEVHPSVLVILPQAFVPNVFYKLGELSGNKTFSLATPADATTINHYYWTFETGSTPPTITWPANIAWIGGSAPEISADKHYEISIINNYGTFIEI